METRLHEHLIELACDFIKDYTYKEQLTELQYEVFATIFRYAQSDIVTLDKNTLWLSDRVSNENWNSDESYVLVFVNSTNLPYRSKIAEFFFQIYQEVKENNPRYDDAQLYDITLQQFKHKLLENEQLLVTIINCG